MTTEQILAACAVLTLLGSVLYMAKTLGRFEGKVSTEMTAIGKGLTAALARLESHDSRISALETADAIDEAVDAALETERKKRAAH